MIDTIFFDIGGVLIDIQPERTIQYWSDCTDIDPDIIQDRFPWNAHNEYEKGQLTDHEWFMAVKESLPQPCCLKESDFRRGWELLLGGEKETIHILQTLSDNHSIWLLSNTNPQHIHDEIEKRYKFPHMVNGAVYSFNVGLRKPDQKIYKKAASLANTRPETSIFIDDLEINVHSAEKAGFTGIHFQSIEQLEKDLIAFGLLTKETAQ